MRQSEHQGPVLPVQIDIPEVLAAQLQAQGKAVPEPAVGVALIDTGAGISGIDPSAIAKLQVQPVGQVMVATPNGEKLKSKYPARFSFPGTNLPGLSFNELVEAELSNQQIPGLAGPLIALVGRDILHHFVLIYNGPAGNWTIAC